MMYERTNEECRCNGHIPGLGEVFLVFYIFPWSSASFKKGDNKCMLTDETI